MPAYMQNWPLTVDRIINHAARSHGNVEVVTQSIEGPVRRTSYRDVQVRAQKLSDALGKIGVVPGDRIATLAWNTDRHLETWYGIMGMGAICHTLNPRLFDDQLSFMINHAEDRIIFTDITFVPLLARILDAIPLVEKFVVFCDESILPNASLLPNCISYGELLSTGDALHWSLSDENAPAGLCYTSGTTGDPKGVVYTHRSNVLHTLMTMAPDLIGLSARDAVLPIVPMYHANAWGLAFTAPAAGAKLVMPGARLDGLSLCALMEAEGVTFAAAVPTVWQDILMHIRKAGSAPPTLKRIVIGGAAAPEYLVRSFEDDFGITVSHLWGMTELSPVGTATAATTASNLLSDEDQHQLQLKQGRAPFGVELHLVSESGEPVPSDGGTPGRLLVRGHSVVSSYYRAPQSALDSQGYFDTGDIATIDEFGFMQVVDRAKDVIKSGGEWISSIGIENVAVGHPAVALAAVISRPDPRWGERPVLFVTTVHGSTLEPSDLTSYLEGKIARWWMPDVTRVIDAIPVGPTGKVDKKALRRLVGETV